MSALRATFPLMPKEADPPTEHYADRDIRYGIETLKRLRRLWFQPLLWPTSMGGG